ncbi:MAG: TldD/PmbA family protein [Pseudomonadota bacterium]
MASSLEDLTEAILRAAKLAGADAADALAVAAHAQIVDVRAGALEQAERAESIDIGLRVFVGRKQACVSATNDQPDTISALAERAVAMAHAAPDDPNVGLAKPEQLARDWDIGPFELSDPEPEPTPAELQNKATQIEAAALAVPGVQMTSSTTAEYVHRNLHIAASNGFRGGYARTQSSLSCVAIAGEGASMQRDYDGDARIFASDLRSPGEIGAKAGERAVAMTDARKPPTGSYPVLFDERISMTLIGHLLSAANGASVARGSSWLLGKMGEPVLPKGVSLFEEPHRPRVTGSRPFDAEGLPTKRRAIVEDGVLQGWLLDLATGRKLSLPSTSNAQRGTTAPPSPGAGNVTLSPGQKTRDELIADMGTGLLVTSMIGSTINPNTGDYSRGASGFWIENGQITYPVQECTIAGSLPDMLLRMTPANDARSWLSRVVPSLLVEGMTLAGE